MTQLDHLVIIASTLAEGTEFIRSELGVTIAGGGAHARMGTHNHVMQLGNDAYLELIAFNPEAPKPDRPRWFDMDNPLVRHRLATGPALMHWVVNVDDFAQLPGFDPHIWGFPFPMQRGQLNWQIAVPEDGRLPGGGLLPTVIQWQSDHPAAAMDDLNCKLESLTLFHPQPDWLQGQLDKIDANQITNVPIVIKSAERSHFSITLNTPLGRRTLASH